MQKNQFQLALSDFNKICRVCLTKSEGLQSVYEVNFPSEGHCDPLDVRKLFKKYCDLEICPTDEKPQQICLVCIKLLYDSCNFFKKCAESNDVLEDIIRQETVKIEIESAKLEPALLKRKRTKSHDAKYHSESEDDVFVEDNDSDWDPSNDQENVDLKEDDFNAEKTKIDDDFNTSDEESLALKGKKITRKRKLEEKTRSKKLLTRRGRRKKTDQNEIKPDPDECDIENTSELVCRLCGLTLSDINASIQHYDESHAPELEVNECIFCQKPKVYKLRDNLLYHMALHSKDSIKCIPCMKYFKTKELLEEHLNECFKVDIKSIKLDLDENCKKDDGSVVTQLQNTQLSQKILKQTQYDGAFKCQLCQEHLGEIDSVIEHFEKVHLADLSCIICKRTFTKPVPLFHLGLHSTKSHICRPCRLFFKTKEEYDKHCAKFDHDKSLTCKICGKKFTRNYKKNKHMLSHLKEKNYSCNKCGKTFTYKTSLVRHFKMHFGKRFLCSSCGNAYTTKFMLQRHIRIMHTMVDEDGKPLPKPPPKPVKLQCEFCGEIFTTKYGYGRHIRRHPEFREFKCKICSFMCDTREQLDVHMEEKHNKHTCDVCGKRFPFESELKTHHRKHEDMESSRFRCDVCGKTARTQTQLKVHYRIHTGERPFSCEICGKSFKQTAHLKVHMFQHTGKMPFKCMVCEKSFPFQHVMEIHMRTHTGEKPFLCVICGNAYHDRSTMQKHQKKKHPEMPIQKVGRSDYSISKLE
ncbi:oocyte zinc finger protein XlCOF6-like [Anthonomus grandis grandis]|uniref:oocyte zinc finger protein XlCOF6-like n=1 Tax=Anthonomus grandis grandis TaxID=2921223 RepID=UPI0021650823|nr:oocyte zinc finger protein XlCOF6-like [Anthonomus grandis grandis]